MLSTILIIDKRKEFSIKYKKYLDGYETEAVISQTLKEAIENIQKLEPDLIIVSDSIDDKIGDFCKRIRALTYNTRPIIVALSKSADVSDMVAVLESGADDFISEPVNAEEFKSRIKAHLRREIETNLDNKTLLPGLKIAKKALKRLLSSENRAVLLAGIENLKEYSSIYTEIASDKLIQTFIAIIKSALDENDFIGQADETNFVIITSKYSAEKLAEFIVFAFDTVVPKFYSENDAKRGYILLNNNNQAGMRANFVSALIGGITEGFGSISNPDILIDKLYEIKRMAKIPSGSNYVMERLKLSGADSVQDSTNNGSIYIKESDDSLKYLLRTTLELQGYDVTEDIDKELSIQPSVLIIDSGDNLEDLEICKELKNNKNFVNTKIIVTSTVHDKDAVLSSGADLYLPKPYEISDLIQWVEYFKRKENL